MSEDYEYESLVAKLADLPLNNEIDEHGGVFHWANFDPAAILQQMIREARTLVPFQEIESQGINLDASRVLDEHHTAVVEDPSDPDYCEVCGFAVGYPETGDDDEDDTMSHAVEFDIQATKQWVAKQG